MAISDTERAFMKHMGLIVRDRRLAHGWTQVDLARESGLSERTISKVENGETGLRFFNATGLAEALEINLEDLTREGEYDAI